MNTWIKSTLWISLSSLAVSTSPAFDFAELEEKAKALAEAPYAPPPPLPPVLEHLNYDQYRAIAGSEEGVLWDDETVDSPFSVQFHHPGYLFKKPVRMNLVDPDTGEATALPFEKSRFDYEELAVDDPIEADEIHGYGGFKVFHPLGEDGEDFSEVASFAGASYFRLLGKDQSYGVSARGLALDTRLPGIEEEFPDFLEYWLVEPRNGEEFLEFFALLDSPSVTGAYRFEIEPGVSTEARIEASLFFRERSRSVGLAPLTSMFWFGENHSPRPFADWRPEVHDSDGLLVLTDEGETVWRPLYNHESLRDSYFQSPNARGFGLLQRDRDFDNYQDLVNPYHRTPSAWITPKGDWGDGAIRLVELPTGNEAMDNIVTYFEPERSPGEGENLRFAYTLSWKMHDETALSPERVLATRVGEILEYPGTHRFVVDFGGPELKKLPPDAPVFAEITSSENGYVSENRCFKNDMTDGWRVQFKLDTDDDNPNPVELRCILKLSDTEEIISETWNYQWSP